MNSSGVGRPTTTVPAQQRLDADRALADQQTVRAGSKLRNSPLSIAGPSASSISSA